MAKMKSAGLRSLSVGVVTFLKKSPAVIFGAPAGLFAALP